MVLAVPVGKNSRNHLPRIQLSSRASYVGQIVNRPMIGVDALSALLAAFTVPVLVITRDQDDSMEITIGE